MKKKVISLVFIIVLFLIIIPTGFNIRRVEEITDAERFASEFSIVIENPFHYIEMEEVLEIFESGTGIVLFADPDSELDRVTIEIFTEVLKENNVETVYYFNIKRCRDNNTEEFQELMELIEKFWEEENVDIEILSLPDVFSIKEGVIIGHSNEVISMQLDKEEYLTEVQINQLRVSFAQLIQEFSRKECINECELI